MAGRTDRASVARAGERVGDVDDRAGLTISSARLERVASEDLGSARLLERLLRVAVRGLSRTYRDGDFVFRLDGSRASDGSWRLTASGKSVRYGAIAALGLLRLPERAQRQVLDGDTCSGLIGKLTRQLGEMTNRGDVALLCWAAAEAGHSDLPLALGRLAELDQQEHPGYVVDAAWVVSALVAVRRQADVEQDLDRARRALLAARGAVLYPHMAGPGAPWYRAHVGSFADQVYPLQALARLHASADDPEALAAAETVAEKICAAQGEAGQWWWHYDSRNGSVVEGYPVYSVHQHAMAPMALLDLADAGGTTHLRAITRGLQWMAGPPETDEDLIVDGLPVTWRKVARGDPRKAVRGLRAVSTRIRPEWRLPVLDKVAPPGIVDHECRPYELGWLLMTWLT
jgi:hypothetical protein